MSKQKASQELSIEELRWLLVEKRRAARQARLDRYRRSGRVVTLASDLDGLSLENWRSEALEEAPEAPRGPSIGKRVFDGFLLLIEISAVVGFVYILFSGLNVLR